MTVPIHFSIKILVHLLLHTVSIHASLYRTLETELQIAAREWHTNTSPPPYSATTQRSPTLPRKRSKSSLPSSDQASSTTTPTSRFLGDRISGHVDSESLEDLRKQLEEATDRAQRAEDEVHSLQRTVKDYEAQQRTDEAEILRWRDSLAHEKERMLAAARRLDKFRQDSDNDARAIADLRHSLAAANSQLSSSSQQLHVAEERVQTLQSDLLRSEHGRITAEIMLDRMRKEASHPLTMPAVLDAMRLIAEGMSRMDET